MDQYDNQDILNMVIDGVQDQLATVAFRKFQEEFQRKPNEKEEKSILASIEEKVDTILDDFDSSINDMENELELDIEEMLFAAQLDEAEEIDDLFEDDDTFGLKTETKEPEVKIDEEESEVSWNDA